MAKETTLSDTVMQSASAASVRFSMRQNESLRILPLNKELLLESTLLGTVIQLRCNNLLIPVIVNIITFDGQKRIKKNHKDFFRGNIFQNHMNMSHA